MLEQCIVCEKYSVLVKDTFTSCSKHASGHKAYLCTHCLVEVNRIVTNTHRFLCGWIENLLTLANLIRIR